jgi:hypothetical protein
MIHARVHRVIFGIGWSSPTYRKKLGPVEERRIIMRTSSGFQGLNRLFLRFVIWPAAAIVPEYRYTLLKNVLRLEYAPHPYRRSPDDEAMDAVVDERWFDLARGMRKEER